MTTKKAKRPGCIYCQGRHVSQLCPNRVFVFQLVQYDEDTLRDDPEVFLDGNPCYSSVERAQAAAQKTVNECYDPDDSRIEEDETPTLADYQLKWKRVGHGDFSAECPWTGYCFTVIRTPLDPVDPS